MVQSSNRQGTSENQEKNTQSRLFRQANIKQDGLGLCRKEFREASRRIQVTISHTGLQRSRSSTKESRGQRIHPVRSRRRDFQSHRRISINQRSGLGTGLCSTEGHDEMDENWGSVRTQCSDLQASRNERCLSR